MSWFVGKIYKNEEGTWVAPIFDDEDSEKRPADAYGVTKSEADFRATLICSANKEVKA